MKKTIYSVLLASVITSIFLLSFQSASGTVRLSENVRHWFEHLGLRSDFHSFRSNAHLVEYFALGVVLTLFGIEFGLKGNLILILGFSVGLLDETVKLFLPTREFEIIDLLKDCIGVIVAFYVVEIIHRMRYRKGKD